MSLTKHDLKQIKAVVNEVIEERIEPRFAEQDKRFAALDRRFDRQNSRFDQQDSRFDQLERKFEQRLTSEIGSLAASTKKQFDQVFDHLADIKEDVTVIKDIVKDHSFRIAKLEHRTANL